MPQLINQLMDSLLSTEDLKDVHLSQPTPAATEGQWDKKVLHRSSLELT